MNQISYENQIARLNKLLSQMKEISQLPEDQLLIRPSAKAWSVVETVVHMNKAIAPHYQTQLDKILNKAPKMEGAATEFKGGRLARFLYTGMRPQEGKRKMKMNTMKRFQPQKADIQNPQLVFSTFFMHYEYLKTQILKARKHDISGRKLTSAIGPIVRFTVPECFEFVIAHAERHALQCELVLEAIGVKKSTARL